MYVVAGTKLSAPLEHLQLDVDVIFLPFVLSPSEGKQTSQPFAQIIFTYTSTRNLKKKRNHRRHF